MWYLPHSIKDILDITLLAVFLYYIYYVLKNSGSRALFMGIMTFIALWILISQVLEMRLMGTILDRFVSIGALVLIIIFQEEIKKFLVTIGSAERWRKFRRLLLMNKTTDEQKLDYIAPIVLSCMNMAKKKVGALIVIEKNIDISAWMFAGERFDAEVNARLIETIFFTNSPLHDGAMMIAKGKIKAAGCVLPVAHTPDLNKDLGLRHRAALGLSQKVDAKVIIISEERGTISLAYHGELEHNVSAEQLQEFLSA